ncbi:oxidoreductase [Phenylobacterium immobile]|uniref:oxidoreductase n=1 Tax=Phenylobacterium immobile TaxID=21 RepID=UPI000A551898|nr:oxidoreductase [Phenylobacterium immobile]
MARIWIMTGASRGLGYAFAEAAAAAGDTVVATARNPESLKPLVEAYDERIVPMKLDVTDRANIAQVIDDTIARFGRIDILCNNAGYGLRGAVEEASEQQVRDQMETNFFGAFWMTQAVLPQMRAQTSGHILQVSSMGGQIAFPLLGVYHASKWALEGFSESLAGEVASFGVKVTIIEPGGFRTDWGGSSMVHADHMEAYSEHPMRKVNPNAPRRSPAGDPAKAAAALMQMLNSDQPAPLRLLMGVTALDMVQEAYHRRLAESDRWKVLARSTEAE